MLLSWWCHHMEIFFLLPAFIMGNSLATGEFHSQRTVKWSFDVFFDLPLNHITILHSLLQKREARYKSELVLTKDTPYLALSGEPWGICWEDFGENQPPFSSTTLYMVLHKNFHYYASILTSVGKTQCDWNVLIKIGVWILNKWVIISFLLLLYPNTRLM